VHLTDLIGGEKRERHLCADCAEAEGVVMKTQQPTLNEILNKFVMQQAGVKELADLRCDQCGMTFVEFRSNGQLGCPNDYEAFGRALGPLIERSHENATQHSGKVPGAATPDVRAKIDLVRLRRELKTAIDDEQYEAAANLRDEIERLEAI
jgi:protein arginine kinase activator